MNSAASPDFSASQKIYAAMLRAYPRRHREEYGAAMLQLFRDQCRDAWREDGSWGLTKLWLRVLPDVVSTSITENFAAIRERKTMNANLANLNQARQTSATTTFISVFVTVFLLTIIIATAVTFILPETYASTLRLKVESDAPPINGQILFDPYFIQTTFEIIQSETVLNPVVEKLGLNLEWGKKYFAGQMLKTSETINILKGRLQLTVVKGTKLIAITVYGEDRNEVARIANAIAEAYKDYRVNSRVELLAKQLAVLENEYLSQSNQIAGMREETTKKEKLDETLRSHELLFAKIESAKLDQKIPKAELVQITDPAEPGRAPVRPNKPLNIVLGAMLGIVLGTISGGVAVWVSASRTKRRAVA